MVAAKWRQWRLWTLETALYDVQMDKQMKMIDETFKSIDETTRCAIAFQTLADESKALALLLRYETSMRRMHERCLATLLQLQKIRKADESLPDSSLADTPSRTLLSEPRQHGAVPPAGTLTPQSRNYETNPAFPLRRPRDRR